MYYHEGFHRLKPSGRQFIPRHRTDREEVREMLRPQTYYEEEAHTILGTFTHAQIESIVEQLRAIKLDGIPFFEVKPLDKDEDDDEIYVLLNVAGNTSGVHSGIVCLPLSKN